MLVCFLSHRWRIAIKIHYPLSLRFNLPLHGLRYWIYLPPLENGQLKFHITKQERHWKESWIPVHLRDGTANLINLSPLNHPIYRSKVILMIPDSSALALNSLTSNITKLALHQNRPVVPDNIRDLSVLSLEETATLSK